MWLDLYDSKSEHPLTRIAVENVGQAEYWVTETCYHGDNTFVGVRKWILTDDYGILCVWERPISLNIRVTHRAKRYTGTWIKDVAEVSI